MFMLKTLAASTLLLGLTACATPMDGGGQAVRGETIRLAVGPCFGFCPVYSLSVAPDGAVRFEGERHTTVVGVKEKTVSPQAYQAVARSLAEWRPASGTSAQTECERRASDLPTYTVVWTSDAGEMTTLHHDGGCMSAANSRLKTALQAIPGQLGVEPWLERPANDPNVR
jgi:hypothetical protein